MHYITLMGFSQYVKYALYHLVLNYAYSLSVLKCLLF